jgi:hypothetical protein
MQKHPAFEIYAGNVEEIRAACAADRLDDLRSGKVTPYLALFPEPFTASDISLVEKAVAEIVGRSEPLEFDRTEEQGCLFVDKIATPWVNSVAGLGPHNASALEIEWRRAYHAEEKEQPEWSKGNYLGLLTTFISVCQKAKDSRLDLVMVWLL